MATRQISERLEIGGLSDDCARPSQAIARSAPCGAARAVQRARCRSEASPGPCGSAARAQRRAMQCPRDARHRGEGAKGCERAGAAATEPSTPAARAQARQFASTVIAAPPRRQAEGASPQLPRAGSDTITRPRRMRHGDSMQCNAGGKSRLYSAQLQQSSRLVETHRRPRSPTQACAR